MGFRGERAAGGGSVRHGGTPAVTGMTGRVEERHWDEAKLLVGFNRAMWGSRTAVRGELRARAAMAGGGWGMPSLRPDRGFYNLEMEGISKRGKRISSLELWASSLQRSKSSKGCRRAGGVRRRGVGRIG